MGEINQQVEGPLSVGPKDFNDYNTEQYALLSVDRGVYGLAFAEKDANLLTKAYNVFDGAGRTLGVDAAELAERLGAEGLVSMITLLRESVAPFVTETSGHAWLGEEIEELLKGINFPP